MILTKIEGDSVKIGISAPRSISILILEEMQSYTLAAGSAKKLIAQMRALRKIPSFHST